MGKVRTPRAASKKASDIDTVISLAPPPPPPPIAPQARPENPNIFGDGTWRFFIWAGKRLLLAGIGAMAYAAFYAAGYVNYEGALGVFGIDNHAFPQPASEYFTLAAKAYGEALNSTFRDGDDIVIFLLLTISAVFALGLIMTPIIQLSETQKAQIENKNAERLAMGLKPSFRYRIRTFMTSWEPLWLKIPILGAFVTFLVWLFLSYVLATVIMFTYVPYRHGVEDSLHDKRIFTPCTKMRFVKGEICVYLLDKDKKVIASGIQVAVSEKLIAIYDGFSATVYPRDGLTEFVPNRNPPALAQEPPKATDSGSRQKKGKEPL